MLASIKAGKKLRKIFFNIIAILFLTQAALASYDTKYNDEFDSGTLDTIRWHWIRESPPNWIMNGTSFQMNVTNSDMYQIVASAPLLLQNITDNNISIITKLSATPTTNSEGGGLIFYRNDNNFVQYLYFTHNGGATKSLVLKKEENNVAVFNYSIDITSDPIYLMLNKTGTSYTAYYSTSEGGSWIQVYNYILNTAVNQAGLVTAGSGSSSGNAFIYDYFRAIRSDTMSSITDPLTTTNNFWINNTWVNPSFVDFNQTMFKFANDTVYMNVSNTTNFMNITYSPHYTQNLSAQTMDTSGNVNSIRVWFNASIPNNIPVQAGILDKTVTAGNWLNFTISAADADSDIITYNTNATKGAFNTSTGSFTWLTTGNDVGTYIWEFSSSDIYGGIDTETITVIVNAAPTYLPPSPVSISSSQGNFWINYTWSSGPGNVTDSYNISVNGVWNNESAATYNNSTLGAHGWSNISVYAFNSSGTGTLNPIPLTSETQINNNVPVQAGILDKTVTAGNWLNFTVSAADPDGDTPTYGTNATKGSLDPLTGEFTWLTTGSDVGTYIWEFSSSDIYGGIDTETITVTVNTAPTYLPPSPVSISSSQGNFWINYTWSSGPGNVTDSYNVSVNGVWNNESAATYNNSTLGAHGWSNISVYAFNSSGTGTLNSVPLTNEKQINNNAPVQAGILDKTVTAGNWLNFTIGAMDADGDTITYGTNATKGEFNTSTGSFNWSTTSNDVAIYVWEFNSSDGTDEIDTKTITVTVNAAIVTTTAIQSSSGSDGGTGSGVISAEPYDNIDRSDMTEMYLVLNTPVLFTFKFPELSIYEIAVTGKETENYMALKVEALKGPTKNPGISAFSGTVYKNVNVWASSKNIKEGQIRFKVENTWIANAGNDLRMVKWDGSKWVDIETSEIKKDDTYTFYEANTDSFGSFAITSMKAEDVPAEVVEKTAVDLTSVTPSSTPVPTKTPGFEAIIAIFAIGILAALIKNNKQRR